MRAAQLTLFATLILSTSLALFPQDTSGGDRQAKPNASTEPAHRIR